MNNERRGVIDKVVVALKWARTEVAALADEERDSYDNLPANLQ